jgi:hypothetical protein
MDDNGSVETLFWAHIRWNFVFGLGSFSRYFRRKLLKSFPFLAPGICPLVNLPSIKEPTRPRDAPIQLKT